MATLEKIRSKSVLLLIIIGVALLAFIIGDFFNSSRHLFGDDMSVAVMGSEKIDPQEFNTRLQQATANSSADNDEMRAWQNQQVLRQMLIERLQKEEFEKLGLTVTDEELNDAIFGANAALGNMMVAQMSNGAFQSAAQFRDYCDNPQKYGDSQTDPQMLRQSWVEFENNLSRELLNFKFQNMLSGTMAANKLDIEQMYGDDNTGYMISYVKKAYTNDPTVKVTDDEINKMWEADKANYALDEETRLVGMIALEIAPSVEDEEAARKAVSEVLQGLNTTPELEALRGHKGFNPQRTTMTKSFIAQQVQRGGNSRLKEFADSAAIGTAALLEDGPTNFQIAKLFGRDNQIDSLTFNLAIVPAGDAAKLDSVKTAIAAGKKAEDLMALGEVYAFDSIATSITNPTVANSQIQSIVASDLTAFKDSFLNADLGTAFVPDTTNSMGMTRIYTVTNRKEPESTVDIALISYTLEPSNATVNALRERLEKYIAANPTADKFAANAAGADLNFDYTDISASNPYVMLGQNQMGPVFLPGSNAAAVWALDADKGAVSPVFGDERTGVFLVASVNDIFTDYRTTADPRVKADLTQKVRNSKSGDSMVKTYAGKASDINGYATLLGSDVAQDAVNFNSSARIYGPELLARIVTTGKGKLVGPSKGADGVVVFQVTDINKPVRPVDLTTDANAVNMRRAGAILQNSNAVFRMLLGDRKYENRLFKVFKNN
ncbi:MAG: SurA N-terminal domain-containing protein [Bacteroides sp.]|nr:SurA N-terminal domain-containing protein [Bacteroides sp.]MCM1412994.1 SurA N-terminal domain-containing protein [Bacteroides sp.]MCM1471700.1 SurA N-terminal domain-containing protein [Bacteroides sp.]